MMRSTKWAKSYPEPWWRRKARWEYQDRMDAARARQRPALSYDKADLARALGLRVDARDDRGDAHALASSAVHEAGGHALICCLTGTRFSGAHLSPDGSGEVKYDGPDLGVTGQVEDRVAICVSGAVAEQLVYGRVGAFGMWPDLQLALARCKGDADLVRQQIDRTDAMLRRHEGALYKLASALVDAKELTGDACRDIARGAGVEMPPVRFEMCGPPDEEERVREIWAAIEAWEGGA